MCTIIPKRVQNRPKTAKKDITVYKSGRSGISIDNMLAQYQAFNYERDKVNYTEFTFDPIQIICSDEVEHKYYLGLENKGVKIVAVGQGFHSFKESYRLKLHKGCPALFIIPKGSLYYENECGNLVSNRIIFKKFLKS